MRVHIHVRVRVCLCVFVVWCRVMSCAARGWVVGVGAVFGAVRCGVCVCCRSIATEKSGAFND